MYAAESLSCYVGSEDGIIFHIDEKLVLRECANVETMIKAMLVYEAKNILVVVTTTMMLIQFSCAADGSLTELMKVRALVFIFCGTEFFFNFDSLIGKVCDSGSFNCL